MHRCLSDSQLLAMLEEGLDHGAEASIGSHLDKCSRCRQILAALLDSGAPLGAHLGEAEVLDVGTRVDRYVVEGVLGTGGMGTVYMARDPKLGRTVALKVLFGDTARIAREAQVMALLSHPNVVPIYSLVSCEHGDFLAMEHVLGLSLRQWLSRAPRTTPAIVNVFLEAGSGLAAAHEAGVVHRDFKPDNVLVDPTGRARLTDFGLADVESELPTNNTGTDTSSKVGGTLAYAAPEQLEAREAGPLADQYAFCVSLCEALTGRRPRHDEDDQPRLPSNVPTRIAQVIRRGLAREPSRRFSSMSALLGALRRTQRPSPWLWTGPIVATVAVVAIVASSMGRASENRTQGCSSDPAWAQEVWTQERGRQLVEHAPLNSRASAEAVVKEVQTYVERWEDARTHACHASGAPAGVDACLAHRLSALDALLTTFETFDESLANEGASAVLALEDPNTCSMSDGNDVNDAAVKAVEDAIARSMALLAAGRRSDALALLRETARANLEASRAPSVEARFHLALGACHTELEHWSEADSTLQHALWRAVARGQHQTAFRASRGLANLSLRSGELEAAELWLRRAETHVDRLGAPAGATADLLFAWGNLYARRDQLDEALIALREAQRIHSQAGIETAKTLGIAHNVAMVVSRRSGPEQALELHRINLEQRRERLGARHPDVAESLLSIGAAQISLRQVDAAADTLTEAQSIYESTGDSEGVIDALENLGIAQALAGRLEDARASLLGVRKLAERGGDPLLAGHVSVNLGDLALMMSLPGQAEREFRTAIRHLETRVSPRAPLLAHAIGGVGEAYVESGRAEAALGYFERSMEIFAEDPSEVIGLARVRFGLARALWDAGSNPAEARALASRARTELVGRDGEARELRTRIDAWSRDHATPSSDSDP